MLLSFYLGQQIYPTDDIYSALRSHDFTTSIYGNNPGGRNDLAFNGTGVLSYQLTHPVTGAVMDNINLINYQAFGGDNFVRDPERYGTRPNPTAPMGQYVGERGVPWTYPDLNNVFLAAVNSQGEVLRQSYHRPETGVTFDPNNPSYNNGWQKYLTMRPHPTYHPLFVTPDTDGGGDVKNLDWARGVPYWDVGQNKKRDSVNDSFWLDLGYPVLTAVDGRKYKPLFAPLIIDLDNRVNLWAAGGYRAGAAMNSNQGFGRWEINPLRVLANGSEYPNLFVGANGVAGRFGGNGVPDGARCLMANPTWYNRFDFDSNASGPVSLPQAGSLLGFPTYPATTWDSADALERTNHPWLFSPLSPGGDDTRRLAASNMEAQLRWGGKARPALAPISSSCCPSTWAMPGRRNMTTLLSFDFNKPGLVPWYTHDPNAGSTYTLNPAAAAYPTSTKAPFPSPAASAPEPAAEPACREREQRVRDRLAFAPGGSQSVNLNRPLRDYPKSLYQDPTDPTNLSLQRLQVLDVTNGGVMQQFADAQADRQQFALDIYKMLVQVTGASDPNAVAMLKTDGRFLAARWLAQLAVNIVDYIDTDEISTPFLWYKQPGNANDTTQWETVFGTELPRLVINETYAQYDNDPADLGIDPLDNTTWKALKYKFNCWVELHNPFLNTPGGNVQDVPYDRGEARLKIDASNVYRVVVTRPDAGPASFDNLTGTTDAAPSDPAKLICLLDDWTGAADQQKVLPGSGYYAVADGSNQGFYCVGPTMSQYANAPFAARKPNLPTTWTTDKMSKTYGFADADQPTEFTVVLQRLACPYMPLDNNPASSRYNPYITVDVMEGTTFNNGYYDGRFYNNVGILANAPAAPTAWSSRGRRQPYAAHTNLYSLQNPVTQAANQPKHTFFRHNAREDATLNASGFDATTQPNPATPGQTLTTPFNWLLHLDRQLINPLELLHVSAQRPYNLTQTFLDGAGNPFQHYAKWFAADSMLYRFLEMAYTPDLQNGCSEGGRTPGKLNINTLWDFETFLALCDPQAGNGFDVATVQNIYNRLMKLAHPRRLARRHGTFGGSDRPYWPNSAGYTDPIANIPAASLSTTPSSATTLRVKCCNWEAPIPYKQYELMTKIHNNVTTRSNCFAIWLTVGFFEVVDESPPRQARQRNRPRRRPAYPAPHVRDCGPDAVARPHVGSGRRRTGGGAGR